MTYNTSCPNASDLNGTCEINSSGEITSYTSGNIELGAATEIKNLANPQPHVKLTFTNSNTGAKVKYKVKGTPNGSNYDGTAEPTDEEKVKHGVADYEDQWTATAVTVQPAAAGQGY